MKTFLTATAISALMVGSAYAACPTGSQSYTSVSGFSFHGFQGFSFPINGAMAGPDYADYATCHTPAGVGIGEITTGEIENTATPGVGQYNGPVSVVLGPNGVALGNDATVYKTETFAKPGPDGILADDPLTVGDESADNTTGTRYVPVSNGTALGAGAHVGHDGSTAVGAGSKTTADNQVMLGKEGDRITAPGVKQSVPGPVHGIVVVDTAGNLGSDGGALQAQVDAKADKTYVDDENKKQDDVIVKKAEKTYVDDENKKQDDVIVKKADKTYVDDENKKQDSTLESHGETLALHSGLLDAHNALLSQHTARLDEQAKGLAIAIAMPDAWLSDKKRFGIFGAVGGFGDETALGFAAIGRIDETWTLNAKAGSDTEFKEFGWQVGVGAQW